MAQICSRLSLREFCSGLIPDTSIQSVLTGLLSQLIMKPLAELSASNSASRL